jgi:ABC-type dipeptide/oligopeptide/nickel transport system permease component
MLTALSTRQTRSSMLEVMGQDYILTAKSQGYRPKKIIFVWALKNAMMIVITTIGLQFGVLIGGAVVTEKVFGWPGVGEYLVTAIKGRDFQVVQSTVLLIALAFVAVNLLVDILYAFINPKVKLD